jgi:hypothetical protein
MVESVKRPWSVMTCAAAAVHHAFELAGGVGLVFQPYLGITGAAVLWGTAMPAWFVVATRGSERWNPLLAYAAGMSLGGAVLHFTLWPWSAHRGIPLLDEAEGLRPEAMPAYNAIIWIWGLSAAGALVRESRRRDRAVALLGMATAFALRPSARHHFVWVREQARVRPAWWNRALVEGPEAAPPVP